MIFFWFWLVGIVGSLRYFTKVNLNWIHSWNDYRHKNQLTTTDRALAAFLGLLLSSIWPVLLAWLVPYKLATFRQLSDKEKEYAKKVQETEEWNKKIELKELAKNHDLAMVQDDINGIDKSFFDQDVTDLKRSWVDKNLYWESDIRDWTMSP